MLKPVIFTKGATDGSDAELESSDPNEFKHRCWATSFWQHSGKCSSRHEGD